MPWPFGPTTFGRRDVALDIARAVRARDGSASRAAAAEEERDAAVDAALGEVHVGEERGSTLEPFVV